MHEQFDVNIADFLLLGAKTFSLLYANYLTHDFSKSNENWGCEGEKTSQFLWRTLPKIHEMYTQAKTCGQKQDVKRNNPKSMMRNDTSSGHTNIISIEESSQQDHLKRFGRATEDHEESRNNRHNIVEQKCFFPEKSKEIC